MMDWVCYFAGVAQCLASRFHVVSAIHSVFQQLVVATAYRGCVLRALHSMAFQPCYRAHADLGGLLGPQHQDAGLFVICLHPADSRHYQWSSFIPAPHCSSLA